MIEVAVNAATDEQDAFRGGHRRAPTLADRIERPGQSGQI
jgi:hypothetical protein